MAGHSKWSQIKHAKAVTDHRRGKLFTKLAREVIVAAREGGGDPDGNFRLRMAIQRAKDANMPNDNIERAIQRGTGESDDGVQMIEAVYEGYGPGGVAIMLETLTDNRNRTVSDVRTTLTRAGGNLAESGAVAWQFSKRGVITVDASEEEAEDFALVAIDAGADDFDAGRGHAPGVLGTGYAGGCSERAGVERRGDKLVGGVSDTEQHGSAGQQVGGPDIEASGPTGRLGRRSEGLFQRGLPG